MSKPLRLHGIRHVEFEHEAEIAAWAESRGHSLTHTDLWKGEALPELVSFDWLLVMGGPMGVYDDDEYSWLAGEKRFLRQAVDAGKLILGVCLGAQLLSVVLGGAVTRNRFAEIGWHEPAAGLRGLPLARRHLFHSRGRAVDGQKRGLLASGLRGLRGARGGPAVPPGDQCREHG